MTLVLELLGNCFHGVSRPGVRETTRRLRVCMFVCVLSISTYVRRVGWLRCKFNETCTSCDGGSVGRTRLHQQLHVVRPRIVRYSFPLARLRRWTYEALRRQATETDL